MTVSHIGCIYSYANVWTNQMKDKKQLLTNRNVLFEHSQKRLLFLETNNTCISVANSNSFDLFFENAVNAIWILIYYFFGIVSAEWWSNCNKWPGGRQCWPLQIWSRTQTGTSESWRWRRNHIQENSIVTHYGLDSAWNSTHCMFMFIATLYLIIFCALCSLTNICFFYLHISSLLFISGLGWKSGIKTKTWSVDERFLGIRNDIVSSGGVIIDARPSLRRIQI